MDKKNIFRKVAHRVFRIRKFNEECIKGFAEGVKNKRILELGSGKKRRGLCHYSVKEFFDESNEFIQSDIDPDCGHKIVDVTQMDYEAEFDVILCLNVLEHLFDFHKAIKNIHGALKPGGTAVISVPVFYPLHDEPNDYWRFTEHSIKKLLQNFSKLIIKFSGIQEYPFAYYIEATK